MKYKALSQKEFTKKYSKEKHEKSNKAKKKSR